MFRRILIAFDSGQSSRQAVDAGIELASELGAEIALVHVSAPPVGYLSEAAINMQSVFEEEERRARDILAEIHARLPGDLQVVDYLTAGDPAEEIVKTAARWGAQVIVMGTHGAGRLGSFLIGSTAQAVLRKAPCPVLIVKQKGETKKAEPLDVPAMIVAPLL